MLIAFLVVSFADILSFVISIRYLWKSWFFCLGGHLIHRVGIIFFAALGDHDPSIFWKYNWMTRLSIKESENKKLFSLEVQTTCKSVCIKTTYYIYILVVPHTIIWIYNIITWCHQLWSLNEHYKYSFLWDFTGKVFK